MKHQIPSEETQKLNGYVLNRIAKAINGEEAMGVVDWDDIEDIRNPLPNLK